MMIIKKHSWIKLSLLLLITILFMSNIGSIKDECKEKIEELSNKNINLTVNIKYLIKKYLKLKKTSKNALKKMKNELDKKKIELRKKKEELENKKNEIEKCKDNQEKMIIKTIKYSLVIYAETYKTKRRGIIKTKKKQISRKYTKKWDAIVAYVIIPDIEYSNYSYSIRSNALDHHDNVIVNRNDITKIIIFPNNNENTNGEILLTIYKNNTDIIINKRFILTHIVRD